MCAARDAWARPVLMKNNVPLVRAESQSAGTITEGDSVTANVLLEVGHTMSVVLGSGQELIYAQNYATIGFANIFSGNLNAEL